MYDDDNNSQNGLRIMTTIHTMHSEREGGGGRRDRQTDRQTNRQADRQTDRDRRTDRQREGEGEGGGDR